MQKIPNICTQSAKSYIYKCNVTCHSGTWTPTSGISVKILYLTIGSLISVKYFVMKITIAESNPDEGR